MWVLVGDVGDMALEGVVERQHREFDQCIVLGAEAGCFAVHGQAGPPRARAGRVGVILKHERVQGPAGAGPSEGGAGHGGLLCRVDGSLAAGVAHRVSDDGQGFQ